MMDGFAAETAIGSTKCRFVSSHVSFITHWRSPLMRTAIRTGIISLESGLELKLYHFETAFWPRLTKSAAFRSAHDHIFNSTRDSKGQDGPEVS